MASRSLIFIGFMGTGKSTAARRAAGAFGWDLVSTDELIEKKAGMTITEIFKQKGEAGFRDVESDIVKSLKPAKPTVIDAGGGSVLRPENAKILRTLGPVIWMKARPDVIVKRVGDGGSRPLLDGSGSVADQVRKLLAEREPVYKSLADYEVDSSDLTENSVLDLVKIIAWQENLLKTK